jgi:hypothetical protein
MLRETYKIGDFDFAIIYIEELEIFYVMPSEVFISYGSEIHLVETDKRQRKPKSSEFRKAWSLIVKRAVPKVILE